MRELILKKGLRKTKLLLYDDIEQMPIERYNKANKFWMLSDNLGNSFEDIDKTHLSRLFLVAHDKDKVKAEINNLRVLVYNVINEIHPDQMAFAVLVHSVNGKEMTDISDEGLRKLMRDLSDRGLTIGEVKKKTSKRAYSINLKYVFRNTLRTLYLRLTGRRTKSDS
jgi:hypothetical protein